MLNITPNDLSALFAEYPDLAIIDVRFSHEREEAGFIMHSHHIPLYTPDWDINPELVAQVAAVSHKDRPVVVICRNGNRSCDACEMLEQNGFKHIYNLQQGYAGLIELISPDNQGANCSLLQIHSIPSAPRL